VAERPEEAVAETLAATRALHQRGDIDDLEARVDELLRLRHLAEQVDALVGHVRDTHRRLGRGERVRGDDRGGAGERVETPRFPAVRQPDKAQAFQRLRMLPAGPRRPVRPTATASSSRYQPPQTSCTPPTCRWSGTSRAASRSLRSNGYVRPR